MESIISTRPPEEVIIFTRYPRLGKVKSRLIPEIGVTASTVTYRRMAEKTVATVRQLACARPVRRTISFTGGSRQEMIGWLGTDFLLVPQQGESLGTRMAEALKASWDRGSERTVLVGCDCPAMDPPLLETAFSRLDNHDLVLGPSHDGGYYLIGMHSAVAPPDLTALFSGVEWGSHTVLKRTIGRARAARLSFSLLKELHDIDRPEDLKYLHYHSYSE